MDGLLAWSLGLIIPRGLCVSGHEVRASFFSSRIRHRNALTEKAWEDVVQGPDSRDFKISLWRGVTKAT